MTRTTTLPAHAWRTTVNSLPRQARDTLFLLGLIAWITAPHISHLPWWASAFAALLLLWRGVLAWHSQPLPQRWLLVLLLALAVGATLLSHRTIVGRDAGVTFLVVLLALKTLEMHARRDALVVFFLGFFVLLSNFFFSQSLPIAIAMLLALWGLLAALVNAHMPVGKPPLAQSLRIAGTMTLWGAPVMVVLFVFFPRMAPLWGMPSDGLTGRSGLSGQMQVGTMARLALDDSIALRVQFDNADNTPPPQSQLYFRGPVLSEFDGRTWQLGGAGQMGWPSAHHAAQRLQVEGEPVRYTITLEPSQNPWLLVLDVAPDKPELDGWNAHFSADLQWLTTRPISDVLRYRASSYPTFRYGPERMDTSVRLQATLPANSNPRTVALARSLLAQAGVAAGGTPALVAAALQRLQSGGYEYTLEPGVYGEHTADEFWFDRKAGFCEHIASAFVVLMRAAGVPARIVTGYQGGERNPVDGYWTVRQSDAHAWAEVWISERGWVRIDPTGAVAPGRIGQLQRLQAPLGLLGNAMGTVISPGMAQQLRAAWEAVNNRWNQWVLNYTQTRQLDVLKALGFQAPDWQDLARILGAIVGLAALAGALWTRWERTRRDPWLRVLDEVRQQLQQRGLSIAPNSPPRTLAQAALASYGESARALYEQLLQLERLRYAAESANAHAALRTLQKQLRAHPPFTPIAPPPSAPPDHNGPPTIHRA